MYMHLSLLRAVHLCFSVSQPSLPFYSLLLVQVARDGTLQDEPKLKLGRVILSCKQQWDYFSWSQNKSPLQPQRCNYLLHELNKHGSNARYLENLFPVEGGRQDC